MLFENFIAAETALLWGAFAIALVMGVVVNKTNFCTMGAVSDLVNMGDTGRMRSWLFAIAVSLLGVAILEYGGLVDATNTFPPYRAGSLLWAENILGGLLFGIGMTLASGCGNKTLIRIGGGNLKSVVVFLIIAVIAYFMISPFPGSDQTLMSLLFYDWIRPCRPTSAPRRTLVTWWAVARLRWRALSSDWAWACCWSGLRSDRPISAVTGTTSSAAWWSAWRWSLPGT